ncbi:hypothetical protein QTP88_000961 [Uroleucon formosanum]
MDQCSIFIRYVVDGMIHERLISVKSCIDSTGKGMMNLLKKAVDTVGLDITHCIGNATDGAANMRGAYNGFTSWLSEEAPGQESYQRMNLWKELSEKDNIHKRLQAICETRWTAKETAIKRLFGTYNSLDDNGMLNDLLLVLTKIVQNPNLNPDVRSKARNSTWCGNFKEVCNTFITNTNKKIETMAISYKLNVEQIQSTFKEKRMAKKKKTFNYENEEDLITTPEKKFTIEVLIQYWTQCAFLTLATKLKPFIPFNGNKENNVPDIRNRLSEELWNFSNSWKYLKNSLEEEYDKITLNETIGEDQDENEENYENLSTPCNLTCKSCSICCYRSVMPNLFSSAGHFVFKEFNIKRHYETKHEAKFGNLKGELRVTKLEAFKKDIHTQNVSNLFKKQNSTKTNVVQASYKVANLIASETKPLSEGDFIKKCILTVVEEIIPEKLELFKEIGLSRNTITRRVENIGNNILTQLQNKARDFKYFSLALDESTDITDTAQLLIIIRGIDINFNVTEELASLKSMHNRTTGADMFEKVDLCLQDLKLDWKNLSCITTDGAPNMRGENIGFVGRVNKLLKLKNIEPPINIHCIIHQQALCGKVIGLEHVMSVVTKAVNFIRSHGLTHRQFQSFLLEIEAEYNDVVYHNHVRWLSRGKVLKRFFDLRKEIEMFMIDKGKPILELKDDNWLWDLAFLTDVTTHLNILNLKLQGPGKFIFDMYNSIKAFDAKLKLFINQIERSDFSHFENCQIFKNNTKSLCSTNRFVCMLNKLQTDISSRFSDVKLHEKSLRLFENPFNIDEIDVDTSFQLELIELKTNSFYYDEFQTMKKNDILKCYSTLSHEDFPALRDILMKMATVFGSTYICEQIFSRMKQTKSVHRSRLTDEHLHSILRIGTTKFQPDFSLLVKETQVQISH